MGPQLLQPILAYYYVHTALKIVVLFGTICVNEFVFFSLGLLFFTTPLVYTKNKSTYIHLWEDN